MVTKLTAAAYHDTLMIVILRNTLLRDAQKMKERKKLSIFCPSRKNVFKLVSTKQKTKKSKIKMNVFSDLNEFCFARTNDLSTSHYIAVRP